MKFLKISAYSLMVLFFCSGCQPDLTVNKLEVVWDSGNKKAKAEIANAGTTDAGNFQVYFYGDENPESQKNRPWVSSSVPGLAKGATVTLSADFTPLARPENDNLSNVYQVTVFADRKNSVAETNENNNEMSAPAFKAENEFIFTVLGGNAGVSGYGGQGPSGDNLSFIIDLETGWTIFNKEYTHVTFISSPNIPSELTGTTIRLKRGVGRYDFLTKTFDNLQFDVQVEDSAGSITTSTHSFYGRTTYPLTVPTGSCPTSNVSLELSLTTPFSIDLGGGFRGNLSISSSKCMSATQL